jgi:hypothetical protein
MQEFKAPAHWWGHTDYSHHHIFLGGSIEMGVADNWQMRITDAFKDAPVVFLNPRRDQWDSSWEQSIHNPQFNEQVNWELDSIRDVDTVIFYFDPNTKSPITLMELGYMASYHKSSKQRILVGCPDGYWRKGNVEVMCDRCGIPLYNTLDDLIAALKPETPT